MSRPVDFDLFFIDDFKQLSTNVYIDLKSHADHTHAAINSTHDEKKYN